MLNVGGKRMLASKEWFPAREGGKPAGFEMRGFQSLGGRYSDSGQSALSPFPLPLGGFSQSHRWLTSLSVSSILSKGLMAKVCGEPSLEGPLS